MNQLPFTNENRDAVWHLENDFDAFFEELTASGTEGNRGIGGVAPDGYSNGRADTVQVCGRNGSAVPSAFAS